MKKVNLIALLLSLCLLVAGPAWPQAGVGSVRGVVRDQTQAVIPGATVTLTNTATNVARTTKTNEVGIYVFPAVTPGPYRIAMEAAGFQKWEGNLTVMVQQDLTVDGALALGQTATQVEVQDVTPIVRVDSPTLGHVLETQRIQQLPMNGRGYQALLATVPGIDSTGIVQAYGMRNNTSVTLFDGAPVNETYEGWDFSRPPGLDSIAEMNVEINNSSAKFTRPTTITLSSKSGTNQVHGALFETNRNSAIGVARRRQDIWSKAPYQNRNEFGASVGGPVYIPKLYNGKDKTFFFFAWEEQRNPAAETQYWQVPTEAMRNGDFRGLVDDSGRQYNLYDPWTTNLTTWSRQPLSYNNVVNTINPSRLSPTAKYLLDITPKPTNNINPLTDYNWIGVFNGADRSKTYSLRLDHRLSDSDLVYGRFAWNDSYELSQYTGQAMLNNVSGTEQTIRPNKTIGATWVHTFSPTMTNEVMFSLSHEDNFRGMGDRQTDYVGGILGLPNPFGYVNWPNIEGLDLGDYMFATDGLFINNVTFMTIQDNATKVKGNHEFQFGFHTRMDYQQRGGLAGAGPFDFSTGATALYDPDSEESNPQSLPYTGFGVANMYLGVGNYSATFVRPDYNFIRREYAWYLQDNWKVTPRLTLNLGLRYELRPPIFDSTGTIMGFDLAKQSYVIGMDSVDEYIKRKMTLPSILQALNNYGGKIMTYKDAGYPQHLININWKQFGPRLGFAYRALEGAKAFVVRGGFRMSYYPQKMQDWVYPDQESLAGMGFQYSLTDAALSPDGMSNYGLRSVPKYIAGQNTPGSIIDVSTTKLISRGDFNASTLPTDYKDGAVADWNLTLEKEIMPNTVARVAYVGNHGYNSQHWVAYNDSTPGYIWYATTKSPTPTGEYSNVARRPYNNTVYGTVRKWTPTGYSWHDSFQFELERRYSKGIGFQIFYRRAKTLLINQDTDDTQSGETVHSLNYYMPGAVPTDISTRDRFLNYRLDNNTRRNEIRWNFIADLPFGRGKKLGNNVNRVVNKIIGGWQVAGMGYTRDSWWNLPTGWWNVDNSKIQVYGYKYPIQDCTSGTCFPGYLWWNGYIPANRINSYDANGKPNGYMGIPSDYKPAATPFIQWGQTTLPANAPANTKLSSYWDTNTVWIPLNNGQVQRTTYNDNLNPWRNQRMLGPWQWFQDASLFKFVDITEKVKLRINIDFFNVLNHPNNPTGVAATGFMSTRNSGSSARTTQLTARLQW